jgi:hypothetical protein
LHLGISAETAVVGISAVDRERPRALPITITSGALIIYGLAGFAFGLLAFMVGLLSSLSIEPFTIGSGGNTATSLTATHYNTILGAMSLTVAVAGIISGTMLLSSRKTGGKIALIPLVGGLSVPPFFDYLGYQNPAIPLISLSMVLTNIAVLILLALGWKTLR